MFAGCALEEIRGPVTKTESKAFSIEEAKEFFEKDFATALTKTSSWSRKQGKLNTGDFTPLWDKAVYSEKGDYAAYDVSIITDRRIIASRGKDTDAKTVRVYQKLVVTQNTSSGKMTAHIMSSVAETPLKRFFHQIFPNPLLGLKCILELQWHFELSNGLVAEMTGVNWHFTPEFYFRNLSAKVIYCCQSYRTISCLPSRRWYPIISEDTGVFTGGSSSALNVSYPYSL